MCRAKCQFEHINMSFISSSSVIFFEFLREVCNIQPQILLLIQSAYLRKIEVYDGMEARVSDSSLLSTGSFFSYKSTYWVVSDRFGEPVSGVTLESLAE